MIFAEGRYDEAAEKIRTALSRAPDLDGGYYLLGRALFSAGRYQDIVNIMEEALAHAGETYHVPVTPSDPPQQTTTPPQPSNSSE